MKTGMLFSPVFARLQTASPTGFASPCLLPPSSSPQLEASKSHACNLFRCNTYEPSRKCGKQRTYRKPKSFRCNTYKKHRGRGVLWLTRNPRKDFYPEEHRDEGPASSSHPVRGVCPVYPVYPELRREPRRERPSGEKDLSLTLQPLDLPACKRPLVHSRHRRDSAKTKFARARCPRHPKPRSLPAHTSGWFPPSPLAA